MQTDRQTKQDGEKQNHVYVHMWADKTWVETMKPITGAEQQKGQTTGTLITIKKKTQTNSKIKENTPEN